MDPGADLAVAEAAAILDRWGVAVLEAAEAEVEAAAILDRWVAVSEAVEVAVLAEVKAAAILDRWGVAVLEAAEVRWAAAAERWAEVEAVARASFSSGSIETAME